MDNVLTIDFKGMLGDEAFEGGTASNFKLELGSNQFIEGFEEQLVGAKEGDNKTVKVKFPKDYRAENLAGKDATFEVAVKEIHDKETPEANDELAKSFGFSDIGAMREAVRQQMMQEYNMAVRNQLKKQLFDVLEERCEFDLPEGMVEQEFTTIWERLKQAQQENDPSLAGKSEDELKEEYRQIAERRVKLGILLAEIGNRQKVAVSREELNRAVMQQASQFPGQEKKVVEFYQKNPERAEDLRGPILEEKVVDHILTQVKYDDQKVSLKEIAESEEDDSASGEQKQKPAKAKTKAKK
jgi:trigger factor